MTSTTSSVSQTTLTAFSVVGKSSDFRDGLDGYYRDEWFAHRTGGGQELAIVEGKTVTRVYGGGVVDEEYLREAGITEEEVSAKHKEFLTLLVKNNVYFFDHQ